MENTKVPHWDIGFQPVHITYRLIGSMPRGVLDSIRREFSLREKELLLRSKRNALLTESGLFQQEAYLIQAEFELALDEALHAAQSGPFYL